MNYRSELVELLNLIFTIEAEQHNNHSGMVKSLSQKSGLSISTINRLYYGAFVYPRFETLQKLCSAVNLTITTDYEITV